MRSFVIALSAAFALAASPLFALDGRQIMEKSDALAQPRSVRAAVLMLVDKAAGSTRRIRAYRKKYGDDEKVLLSFSRPTSIRSDTRLQGPRG